MPAADDVRAEDLAARTRGFSGAEVEHAANEAGLLAVRVPQEHFLAAIDAVRG